MRIRFLAYMMLSGVFEAADAFFLMFMPWRFNAHLQFRPTFLTKIGTWALIRAVRIGFDSPRR